MFDVFVGKLLTLIEIMFLDVTMGHFVLRDTTLCVTLCSISCLLTTPTVEENKDVTAIVILDQEISTTHISNKGNQLSLTYR